MKELKPCPFCNMKPIYGVKYAGTTSNDATKVTAMIQCKNCGVEMKIDFIALEYKPVPFERYTDAFENLINKWNKRKMTG